MRPALARVVGAVEELIETEEVGALALEGLTIPTHTRVTWPLVPGQRTYDVSVGGTIPIPAPVNARSILDIGYYDAAVTPLAEVLVGGVLTDGRIVALPWK